jgi:hypothetical protein
MLEDNPRTDNWLRTDRLDPELLPVTPADLRDAEQVLGSGVTLASSA